jgi:hypothetical protein
MKKTPIDRWLRRAGHTQTDLANRTGLCQASISKMIRVGRQIQVVEDDDETYLVETKRLRGARG